jgi:hypothetical protein
MPVQPPIAPTPGKPGASLAHVYSSSGLHGLVGPNGLTPAPDSSSLSLHSGAAANGIAMRNQLNRHGSLQSGGNPAGNSLFSLSGGDGPPGGHGSVPWPSREPSEAMRAGPSSTISGGSGLPNGGLQAHAGMHNSAAAVAAASRGALAGYQQRQPVWLHRLKELHVFWLKQLHRSQAINAELENMGLYFLRLPPVQQCFPGSSDGSRTPGTVNPSSQTGAPGANMPPSLMMAGAASGGLHRLPSELNLVSDLSLCGSGNSSAPHRRGPSQHVHSAGPLWRGSRGGNTGGLGSNTASLHNGPISAQDLATGMRERESAGMPGSAERPSHSDDGSKCDPVLVWFALDF